MSGGFILENEFQNVDSPSKPRLGLGPQSLRPVTIKQLQEAVVNPDGRLVVDNQELSQFSLISCVRGIKEGSTGTDYFIEDGTASITARCWPDKNIAPAKEGDWIQVFGTFKSLGSTKSVNVSSLKKITDYNQITFHFCETIASSLACSDPTFLASAKNSARKEAKISNIYQSENQNLTPIQNAVYSLYQQCTEPNGVNIHSVIRSLQGKYSEKDVRNTVTALIGDGLLYLTFDGDHAKDVHS